jgi:hypothetical protein
MKGQSDTLHATALFAIESHRKQHSVAMNKVTDCNLDGVIAVQACQWSVQQINCNETAIKSQKKGIMRTSAALRA